jgi:hypothetical protein
MMIKQKNTALIYRKCHSKINENLELVDKFAGVSFDTVP